MIIDIAKQPQWILCTPSKCGTNSVQKLLIDDMGIGRLIEPHHRPDVPDELGEIPVRIMLDREPVDRWCSIYHHIHRQWKSSDGYTPQSMIAQAKDPETFARYYFRCINQPDAVHKKTYIWHYHTLEIAEIFRPTDVLRVTALSHHVGLLGDLIGRPITSLPWENRGHRSSDSGTLSALSREMKTRLQRWAYELNPRTLKAKQSAD